MPKSKSKRTKAQSKGKTTATKAGASATGAQDRLSLISQLENARVDDALDAAQDLIFDAWEADSPQRTVELAKKALELSPRCADAYLILAHETANSLEEAIELLRRGVAAGAEAVGKRAFTEDVGFFWGLIETRPYMRVRLALAQALWEGGAKDEAVDHYQELLRLNPGDNQGVRYILLCALLELGRDAKAAELLDTYADDGSADWLYSGALARFRREGDSPAARKTLKDAIAANPHVPAYLTGAKALPRTLPEWISVGSDDEAVAYAFGALGAWQAADGALAWLDMVVGSATRKMPPPRVPTVPDQPREVDWDRVDDAALALMSLGLHGANRTWKGFDWGVMNRLYEKGYISDPVGKAKSVVFTEAGRLRSEHLFDEMFAKREEGSKTP